MLCLDAWPLRWAPHRTTSTAPPNINIITIFFLYHFQAAFSTSPLVCHTPLRLDSRYKSKIDAEVVRISTVIVHERIACNLRAFANPAYQPIALCSNCLTLCLTSPPKNRVALKKTSPPNSLESEDDPLTQASSSPTRPISPVSHDLLHSGELTIRVKPFASPHARWLRTSWLQRLRGLRS